MPIEPMLPIKQRVPRDADDRAKLARRQPRPLPQIEQQHSFLRRQRAP
jgi:hypothetical protein